MGKQGIIGKMICTKEESMEQPKFSVVVPAYNEEEVLPHTHKRLTAVMEGLGSYEIIYVNDGSRDNTLSILKELAEKDPHVVAVDFSRNFGQQAAVTAGMYAARGRAVILIDADLQDPPETIPKMVERWRAGADVVYGKRKLRKGKPFLRRSPASSITGCSGFYRAATLLWIPGTSGLWTAR